MIFFIFVSNKAWQALLLEQKNKKLTNVVLFR